MMVSLYLRVVRPSSVKPLLLYTNEIQKAGVGAVSNLGYRNLAFLSAPAEDTYTSRCGLSDLMARAAARTCLVFLSARTLLAL